MFQFKIWLEKIINKSYEKFCPINWLIEVEYKEYYILYNEPAMLVMKERTLFSRRFTDIDTDTDSVIAI